MHILSGNSIDNAHRKDMAKTTSENNNNTPIYDTCNHIDEQKQNDKYTVIRNHLRLQNTTLAWQTTVKGGTVNETKK
jgi:hypothetical protein